MSSLVSLQVQGIRSFGTDKGDEGLIQFTSPVTLILGQNGCGKTTLIESLKLASTGDVPDNTNRGSGFLHDPKLSGALETQGVAKLKFTDTKGDTMIVGRPMRVTQKLKSLEFKRLDPSLKLIKKSTGESKSISGRCADVDNMVTSALGVSKAILNNVIFCHQEDSSWPLDEGSKVKARFDAIFEAKKYNQFTEELRKLRKTYKDKLKLMENDLNHLKVLKGEAGEKRASLSDLESRLDASRNIVRSLKEKLTPVAARLREIAEREDSIGRLFTDFETKKTKLSSTIEAITDLRTSIPNEYSGTDAQLREEIANFHDEVRAKERELDKFDKEIEKIGVDLRRNQEQVSEEQVKLGQLSRDMEKNKERLDKRNSDLISISEDLNIEGASSTQLSQLTENPNEVERMFLLIDDAVKEKKSQVSALRKDLDLRVTELRTQADSIREERARMENSILNNQQTYNKTKLDCTKLKNDLNEIDKSAENLSRLQTKLDRVKREINELNINYNLENMEQELKNSKSEREKLEDNLSVIEKDVQSLQEMSKLKAEIEVQKASKTSKDAEIQKLLRRHGDSIKHLLGNIPEQGIKFQLQACMDKLADDVKGKCDEIKLCDKEITTLESEQKHLFEKLRQAKHTLAADECTIEQTCGQKEYETYLSELSVKLQELQDEKGTCSASEVMIKRYVKKLQESNPCCPLCHRGFSSTDEVSELLSELTLEVRKLPTQIRVNKDKLDEIQEKYSNLLQLKPKYEKLSNLKNVEIPSLQAQLEKIERKLESRNEQLAVLQSELSGPQSDEALAKKILSDVVILEQLNNESRKLERDIQKLETKLPAGIDRRSLEDVLKEQKTAREKLNLAREAVEDIQSKITTVSSKRSKLHEEMNSIQNQQHKISGNVQMRSQLAEKLDENESMLGVLQAEIDKGKDDLVQLKIKLEQCNRMVNTTVSSNEAALDKANSKVRKIEDRVADIKKNHKLICEYQMTGGQDRMKATQKNLTSLQHHGYSLNNNLETFKTKKEQTRTLIASQKTRERELDDNMKLRTKLFEEKELTEQINKLKVKIGNMDSQSLIVEKNKLRQEEENINRDRAHAEGRQRELDNSIESIKAELNKNIYKNADKKYKDKLIEIKVQETTIDDLGKYYAAMDWALNHFHTEKMKIINNTIRDLWRQIYRGNDIDSIEIDTENEVVASLDKKRVYNYRVVQIKNGVKLDMRGRCSAGQKVLACLIIRIALAETFSCNCGVLALDEPTTNLDHENIQSLSNALVDLVNSRSHQKNFQLIVITHDETFHNILRRIDSAPYYFKITRNEKGKSRVKKIVLDESYKNGSD